MDSIIFNIQFGLSTIAWGLLAAWFLLPRLKGVTHERVILLLLIPHLFRDLGMYALATAAFNPAFAQSWAKTTAYSDAATQLTAMLAVTALHSGWRIGLPCAWACNIIGSIAYVAATYLTSSTHVPLHELASSWFLPVFFLPVLMWSHIYLFWFLGRGRKALDDRTVRLAATA
jgi:hypothetical protein